MPAAHTPPMPMPNRARHASNMTYDVEKPPRNAKHEYARIEAIERPLAAPPICRRSGADAAHHAQEQRGGAEEADERAGDAEMALDIDEQKRQDGEVKPVEQPPEVGGQEGSPLRGSHQREPGRVPGAVHRAPS